jgi:hypothetical protein
VSADKIRSVFIGPTPHFYERLSINFQFPQKFFYITMILSKNFVCENKKKEKSDQVLFFVLKVLNRNVWIPYS